MGEFVHVYNDGGGIRNVNVPRSPLSISGMPKFSANGGVQRIDIDGLVPKILSSYNTGSTATQSGNTVTVTIPTAHNIPATSYDGFYTYYPGSLSILAGWYPGFTRTGATTFTFTANDSKTVASESINSGNALTGYVDFYSTVIPGGSIGKNGRVTARILRTGDTTASKTLRTVYGGVAQTGHTLTSSPTGYLGYSFCNAGSEAKQRTTSIQDGSTTSILASSTVDSTADQSFVIQGAVTTAQYFMAVPYAELEVNYVA